MGKSLSYESKMILVQGLIIGIEAAQTVFIRTVTVSQKKYVFVNVKDNISTPIRPTSGAATSLTSAANCSRSLYTSSTVSVPRIARKCPSNVFMLI